MTLSLHDVAKHATHTGSNSCIMLAPVRIPYVRPPNHCDPNQSTPNKHIHPYIHTYIHMPMHHVSIEAECLIISHHPTREAPGSEAVDRCRS